MPIVTLPDGREFEFPETMSLEEMKRAIDRHLAPLGGPAMQLGAALGAVSVPPPEVGPPVPPPPQTFADRLTQGMRDLFVPQMVRNIAGQAPAALRIVGALASPPGFPGAIAGGLSEVGAQSLETLMGQRPPGYDLQAVGAEAALNMLPGVGQARGLRAALGGAVLGAGATGISSALREGQWPTVPEVVGGALTGGVLGALMGKFNAGIASEEERKRLANELSARLRREVQDSGLGEAIEEFISLTPRLQESLPPGAAFGGGQDIPGPKLGKLPGGEVLPPVQELLRTPSTVPLSLLDLAAQTVRGGPGVPESTTSDLLREAQETITAGKPGTFSGILRQKLSEETGAVGRALETEVSRGSATLRDLLTSQPPGFQLPEPETISTLATRLMTEGIPQGQALEQAVHIRLNKAFTGLDEQNQLQRLEQEILESNIGMIDWARRGTRPQELTQQVALHLGMTEKDLLARTRGQALNAEHLLAQAYLADAATVRLSRAVNEMQAGVTTQPQFAEELTRYVAILEQVAGARAEAGRALNILRRQRSGEIAVNESLSELFGKKVLADDLQKMVGALLKEAPTTPGMGAGAVPRALRTMKEATTWDKLIEAWKAGLVSGPHTHVVNAVSSPIFNIWNIAEEAATGGVDAIRSLITGTPRDRWAWEAAADSYGQITGVLDALKLATTTWNTGVTPFMAGKYGGGGAHREAIGGQLGEMIRLPFRALETADVFWRSLFERGALHKLAYREAMQQGLRGDALKQFMAQAVLQPSAAMQKEAIRIAELRTFRTPGGPIVKGLLQARAGHPSLQLIIPFVETPTNIMRAGVARSPLALLTGVGQEALSGGVGAREEMLTTMSIGTGVAGVGWWLAKTGMMTGAPPVDEGERQLFYSSGKQPYAIKIGDRWASFGRLEPLGITLGLGADFAQVEREYAIEKEEGGDAMLGLLQDSTKALMRNLGEKSFLSGLSDFVDAMHDPTRYLESYLNRFAGSTVPFSGFSGTLARAMEPTIRKPEMPLQAIQAKMPGFTGSVPPIRDIWGQPAVIETFTDHPVGAVVERFLSPIRVGKATDDPVTAEVVRLDELAQTVGMEMIPGSPQRAFSLIGQKVELSSADYDEYREQSGQLAHQIIERFINAPEYARMPEYAKIEAVQKLFDSARKRTLTTMKGLLLGKSPETMQQILEKKQRQFLGQ